MGDAPLEVPAEVYRGVRRLRMQVLRAVRTRFAGAYASAFRGTGIEFAEFLPYRPGDDARHIDWQVTARRRRPYVKRYVEERELRLLLVMDVSASMDAPTPGLTGRQRALQAAALLALSAAYTGDRVGALFFGGSRVHAVAPRRGEKHALRVLAEGMSLRPGARRTDLRPALNRLRDLRAHAVAVLLSDFLTRPGLPHRELQRLLSACASRHETAAIRMAMPVETARLRGTVIEGREPESGRSVLIDRGTESAGRRGRTGSPAEAVLRRCGVRTVTVGPGADCMRAAWGLMVTSL